MNVTHDPQDHGREGGHGQEGGGGAEVARPVLRVISGDPTPEELAALLAVVAARSGGADSNERPARSAWRDPARLVRRPIQVGPGAWRASALP